MKMKNKDSIFCEHYYKLERKWFNWYKIQISNNKATVLFEKMKEYYPKISKYSFVFLETEAKGIGVIDHDKKEIILGKNPYIGDFIHEIGHGVIECYYNDKGHHKTRHKIVSKRLYSLVKNGV